MNYSWRVSAGFDSDQSESPQHLWFSLLREVGEDTGDKTVMCIGTAMFTRSNGPSDFVADSIQT